LIEASLQHLILNNFDIELITW